MNYSDSHDAAQRYSAARPYIYPLVIEKVKDFIGIDEPVSQAQAGSVQAGRAREHRYAKPKGCH